MRTYHLKSFYLSRFSFLKIIDNESNTAILWIKLKIKREEESKNYIFAQEKEALKEDHFWLKFNIESDDKVYKKSLKANKKLYCSMTKYE